MTRNTPTETATSKSFLFSIKGSPLVPKSHQSGVPAGVLTSVSASPEQAGKQKPDTPGYL
jgi:hypothetical protein